MSQGKKKDTFFITIYISRTLKYALNVIQNRKESFTAFLNPKKEPRKVRGREIPNQRDSRASRVVKGMAADEPAPQRIRLST